MQSTRLYRALPTLLLAAALLIGAPLRAASATSPAPGHTALVRDWPKAGTPNILDGEVLAITQLGGTMLAAGTFTQASNSGSSAVLDQPYLLAFDRGTGRLSTTFRPRVNGKVDVLLPGPTEGTVYVGGQFNTVDGVRQKGVALLNLADGSLVRSFDPPYVNGIVTTLALARGHLLLGGTFHTVAGRAQSGLASLNPTTGARDDYLTVQLTGHHNYDGSGAKGAVGVQAWAITPDETTMVVIGNFRKADGVVHDQIVRLVLGADSADVDNDWNTTAFSTPCNRNAFDSWVRDVDFSPDGSYFVVVDTGGPNGSQLCDSASRWETDSTGTDLAPTWVDHSGGDTFLSVAITEQGIYAGGHFRWLNNSFGHDSPGPGAIGRASIAVLDPTSGLPDSWNGGRNPRGFGITALYPTTDGLWLGYDTKYLGNFQYHRDRIGFYPLKGGVAPHSTTTAGLPGDVYLASPGDSADTLAVRGYDGDHQVGGTTILSDPSGTAWHSLRGAFWIGGDLYAVADDGTLTRRSFTGTTMGSPQVLDPYHDPYWDQVSTGSGQTYRGSPSGFFDELDSVTALTYAGGRLYYTRSGSSALYWRWFDPDSGAIGADRHRSAGDFGDTRAMFTAGSWWYAVDTTGTLTRYPVVDGLPTTSGTVVSGPSVDGQNWTAAALFVGP